MQQDPIICYPSLLLQSFGVIFLLMVGLRLVTGKLAFQSLKTWGKGKIVLTIGLLFGLSRWAKHLCGQGYRFSAWFLVVTPFVLYALVFYLTFMRYLRF
jgi:hypothetical protein